MTKFNVFNLANPTGIPMTQEDVLAVRCRPPWRRTDLPYVGQRVKYRHEEYGLLVDAEILSVDMENRRDPCVWCYIMDPALPGRPLEINGIRQMELVDDPWPSVRLATSEGFVCDTRESRFPGSPGWLPRSVKE